MTRPKKEGYRTRYNGFGLGDLERDRVVAQWIQDQPNAGEAIKAMIYREVTGQVFQQGMTVKQLDDIEINVDDPRAIPFMDFDT